MTISYRPGRLEDSRAVFEVFVRAVTDLGERQGVNTITGGDGADQLGRMWARRRSMFEHLAQTASHFWIAEQAGEVIGYARTIRRGDLQELTEFFVLPGLQASGIGRELLARAFPGGDSAHRVVIATLDDRALVRYLKAGVYARFPVKYFYRQPEPYSLTTDLEVRPAGAGPETLAALAALDQDVLGHQRDVDHSWLLATRAGYLYYRAGRPVGYGYVGESSGPFALLRPDDYPAVLAHAETEAASRGFDYGIEAPLVNRHAVDFMLERGYRMGSFTALFMSDRPFGRFENYLFFTPPFFL